MIRVLVADDHPVVRTGLREIVVRRCDIAMLGEAGTSAEVRELEQDRIRLHRNAGLDENALDARGSER